MATNPMPLQDAIVTLGLYKSMCENCPDLKDCVLEEKACQLEIARNTLIQYANYGLTESLKVLNNEYSIRKNEEG